MTEQITTASLLKDSVKYLWENYGEGFSEWAQAKAEEKGIEFAQNRWKAFQQLERHAKFFA